jgi:sialate O-acetylesterase
MNAFKYLLVFCLAFALPNRSISAVKDPLQLADALQSNMVLQQNKAFKVWGKAKAGEQVSILADWMANPVCVYAGNDGNFMGIIEIPAAKKGDFSTHRLKIETSEEKKELNNLLIGDVWFCSGQSNMQFAVKEMTGAAEVIKEANQSNIRLLNVGLNFNTNPTDRFSGQWVACSAETVKGFSAVGYIFGRKLFDTLNIPIGIIFSGVGASGVQAYIPQDELARNEQLNNTYLKPYLASPQAKEKLNANFSFEKVVRPFLLYNALIHPFINSSIKGICWYQGESNHMERATYINAMKVMIKSWRERFKQGDLPFYYVQIAPYGHEKDDPTLAFDAFFREAQEQATSLNNTAMVSTMDVGDAKDLHPKNKKPVGLRLAAVALNRIYNQDTIRYQGPQFAYVDFKKNKATVHFKPESLGSGLNTNDGFPPKFFYVAGADQRFYPAAAQLEGNTIILHSAEVKHPLAVRYAFFNYPVTNLQNQDGYPANPFRTDFWPEK